MSPAKAEREGRRIRYAGFMRTVPGLEPFVSSRGGALGGVVFDRPTQFVVESCQTIPKQEQHQSTICCGAESQNDTLSL